MHVLNLANSAVYINICFNIVLYNAQYNYFFLLVYL